MIEGSTLAQYEWTCMMPTTERDKQISVDGEECHLVVQECEGDPVAPRIREGYIRNSKGFLFTYSITSRSSFDEISAFIELALQVRDEEELSAPMILVGSKCDLEEERQVTEGEGLKLASSLGCPFFETSALDRINVVEAFHHIVRAIRSSELQKKNAPPSQKPQPSPSRSRTHCSIF
jgi:GTPase KRas